jgi:hypothetical protein
VLWLLYQIIHTLPQAEGDKLFKKLLEPDMFYSLFFHWSWHVRMCFIYFYFFQAERLCVETAEMTHKVNTAIMTIHSSQESKLSALFLDRNKSVIRNQVAN